MRSPRPDGLCGLSNRATYPDTSNWTYSDDQVLSLSSGLSSWNVPEWKYNDHQIVFIIIIWVGLRIFYHMWGMSRPGVTLLVHSTLRKIITIFSQAGHCDPRGGGSFGDATSGPCCSPSGECGNSTLHCDSDGSVNFGEFGQN